MNDDELISLGNCGTPHRTLARELGLSIGQFSGLLYKARRRKAKGKATPAKILVFDIETALMEAYVWSTGEQYIGPKNIKADWYVLSWAATWLTSSKVSHAVLTPAEAKRNDDKRIVTKLWKLINEADIVVGTVVGS